MANANLNNCKRDRDIVSAKLDGESYEAIGKRYGISKSRVRQIIFRIIYLGSLYNVMRMERDIVKVDKETHREEVLNSVIDLVKGMKKRRF